MSSNYDNFMNSYSGRKLLEKHDLTEYGIWRVLGEDPNCDWGGSHVQSYLTTLEGRLHDVIMEGVNLKGFWTWGAGGDFIKTDIVKTQTYEIPEPRVPSRIDRILDDLSDEELVELKKRLK